MRCGVRVGCRRRGGSEGHRIDSGKDAYAGLLGAVLLVAADVLGRVVVGTGEVEGGIVIAVLVGPFFVLLVRRGRMVSV